VVIQVPDINGQPFEVCFQTPGTPTDRSGTINNTGASQTLMDVVATGLIRSGWIVQNKSQSGNTMVINDIGDPADTSPSSVQLAPGETWPPTGYPVTQGVITIAGQAGDNYMAREW